MLPVLLCVSCCMPGCSRRGWAVQVKSQLNSVLKSGASLKTVAGSKHRHRNVRKLWISEVYGTPPPWNLYPGHINTEHFVIPLSVWNDWDVPEWNAGPIPQVLEKEEDSLHSMRLHCVLCDSTGVCHQGECCVIATVVPKSHLKSILRWAGCGMSKLKKKEEFYLKGN